MAINNLLQFDFVIFQAPCKLPKRNGDNCNRSRATIGFDNKLSKWQQRWQMNQINDVVSKMLKIDATASQRKPIIVQFLFLRFVSCVLRVNQNSELTNTAKYLS